MKRKTLFGLMVTLGLTLALSSGMATAQRPVVESILGPQAAVGNTFTYQGRLLDNGAPVNYLCEMVFGLYDVETGGTALTTDTQLVLVTDGYFSAQLPFGAYMRGDARYLQIAVDCGGGSTVLDPRIALTATPYAHSLRPGAVISGTGTVLMTRSSSNSGYAFKSETTATTGNASGVIGESKSPSGAGVGGVHSGSSGGYGVWGSASSTSGYGVYGEATATSGLNYGVYGKTASGTGYGVYGLSIGGGTTYGIYGLAADSGSGTSFGVYGKSNSTAGTGVSGEAPMNGVFGKATASTGSAWGVYGMATPNGTGVYGLSTYGHGVHGKATPPEGYAIYSEGNTFVEGKLSWTPKTSYVAISAAGFGPVSPAYQYANWGNKLTPADSSSPYYYAAVQLPHGATITNVYFAWYDTSGSNNAECKLFRNNLAGGGIEMAKVTSSGSSGYGGGNDPSITEPLVDNSMYAYYLQWHLPDSNTGGTAVVIEYTFGEPY